jgi:hypothetical protein
MWCGVMWGSVVDSSMVVAGGAAGSPDRKSGGVPKYGEAMSI